SWRPRESRSSASTGLASSTAAPICSLRGLCRKGPWRSHENPRKHGTTWPPFPSGARRMLRSSPQGPSERRQLMAKAASNARTSEKGLVIERRFTSPGIHPYEELEWEARDAIIGDPQAEGGPAFKQENVEFPRAWSQNATNIVAQKYFRGQLGSPHRAAF